LNLEIDRLLDFFLKLKSGEFVKKLYLKKKNTNLRNSLKTKGLNSYTGLITRKQNGSKFDQKSCLQSVTERQIAFSYKVNK